MNKTQVTQKDIAKETGLTIASVSRALRNDPQISEATCKRVQKIAQTMGYRPNPYVSNLMANIRRSKGINRQIPLGLLVETRNARFLETSYFNRCLQGVEKRARETGYYLVRIPIEQDETASIEAGLDMLRARGIRGVIVSPLCFSGCDFSHIDWSGLAVVTIGHAIVKPRMPRVASHDYRSIQEVLKQLLNRNYHRIGYCMLRTTDSVMNRGWLAGFKAYQHDLPSAQPVPAYHDSGKLCEATFRSWFDQHRPDVLIFCHTAFARWVESWGLQIRPRRFKPNLGPVCRHRPAHGGHRSHRT
jgi:DNA-binding LacI/PurR family transcriptional regulator